ncbi:MAG: hypothetical protein ACLUVB_02745 [Acutalibacteraceae bacterium]
MDDVISTGESLAAWNLVKIGNALARPVFWPRATRQTVRISFISSRSRFSSSKPQKKHEKDSAPAGSFFCIRLFA